MKVFGETLPNWDFEIVEDPTPGQYRYLQFAWRALAPSTKGVSLQLSNGGHDAVRVYAGEPPLSAVPHSRQVADKVPSEWSVVRLDLWEVFKKPVRIRAMRLASPGAARRPSIRSCWAGPKRTCRLGRLGSTRSAGYPGGGPRISTP
jgi:hypothetical protein